MPERWSDNANIPISLLSLKLKPQDVSFYGPLKPNFNDACNSWQLDNPGNTLTIYNMAELLGKCFRRAMTPSNMTAGLRRPGISPFDRHTFSDDEFLGSYVTEMEMEPQLTEMLLTMPLPPLRM